MRVYLLSILLIVLLACQPKSSSTEESTGTKSVVVDSTTYWLQQAIEAHGGVRYDSAHYKFQFRDRVYTFRNEGTRFVYTRTFTQKERTVVDSLWNDGFSRHEDGQAVSLEVEDVSRYGNALNSVIYFATLPHKLQDAAVIPRYIGQAKVKGSYYAVIEVRFQEEGGGKDFEDQFHYWVNTTNYRVDYLAYNYQVDGGGVRFRSAYNPRIVDGVLFQDYINWKAPMGTPLGELPALWEAEQLKELSRIETQEVQRL